MPRHTAITAFDLDNTLLKDNSSFKFGLYLCKKGHLPFSSLLFILGCRLRFCMGFISLEKLHVIAFYRLFFGLSESLVKRLAQEFLVLHFESLIYLPAFKKLREAQQIGHLTVLLSSSPDFLVEPIAQKLNISIWDSTRYKSDGSHQFSRISQIMLGDKKALFIKELRQRLQLHVCAYSDSHHDLPFLLAAESAVGVNPDRKLRAICKSSQWSII